MTDITKLAQREKFEVWWEREYKHLESSKYTDAVPHIKYGFWMAYQAGGAELVEAVEKAQGMETYWKTQCRGITDHCEELQARIAELESHTVKPPVHPTVASENLDDETLQELIEFRRTTFEYHSKEGNKVQTIIHGVTLAALRELQERRKADSEPVAEVVSIYGDPEAFGEREIRPLVGIQQMPYGTKLYRHAQSVPVVSADLLHTAASAIEDLLTTKDRTGACVWFDLPFKLRSAANAQPAPVVPEEKPIPNTLSMYAVDAVAAIAEVKGWNACRAAMLQELKKSAGAEAICRSDENVQVLHTKSPAQSDCCPAKNVVVPAQNPIDHGYLPECECSGCKATARTCTEMAVNSLVIPNEMTSEQAYEIGYYHGDPVDVFARGANWMRQHIIDSTLAAAPQSPGSEPATLPGKWIPVSEQMPPSRHEVLVGCWWGEKPRWCCKWATYIPGHPDAQSSGWLIPGASWTPTHWMPLPAAPQEVK